MAPRRNEEACSGPPPAGFHEHREKPIRSRDALSVLVGCTSQTEMEAARRRRSLQGLIGTS
jgi:hypothetical protein